MSNYIERYSDDSYVIQSALTPELDVKNTQRAGKAQRDRATAHVEEMLAKGYLTGDEAGKRAKFINQAETATQVQAAISDLPAYSLKPGRGLVSQFNWDNKKHFIPTLLIGMGLGAASGISGIVWASEFPLHPSLGPVFAVTAMVALGFIAFIACLTGLIVKTCD